MFLQPPNLPDRSTLCPFEFAFSGPSEASFSVAARDSVRRTCPHAAATAPGRRSYRPSCRQCSHQPLSPFWQSHLGVTYVQLRSNMKSAAVWSCLGARAVTWPWSCQEDQTQIPNPTAAALWGPAVAARDSSSSC